MVKPNLSVAILLILGQVFGLRSSSEICQDAVCDFTFNIRRQRTMTYKSPSTGLRYNVGLNGSDLVVLKNDFRVRGDTIGKVVDPRNVITADGLVRNVIVINGQFPGPNIEVMEGSQVVVHVINNLLTDGVSIHWHGMFMKGNPWMDGVAYVTQCPILPRQSFTYRFKADPMGTHMYHAHFTNQRLDGLFGQLIVHNRLPAHPEFLLTLIDWWQPEAEDVEIANPWGVGHVGTGEHHVSIKGRRYAVDNNEVTNMKYFSTLLNGRGRQEDSSLPLTKFDVTLGETYRFRMTHSGAEYAYEVSVDDHKIRIVALDGADISPLVVDSFMMFPGEIADFELTANRNEGLYWLRTRTLGVGVGRNPEFDGIIHEGKAVIRYQDATQFGDPTSTPKECSADEPCTVFNCPFAGYPDSHHKNCISIADARSLLGSHELAQQFGLDDDQFEEHFFNFNFAVGANVNGRKFVVPRAPFSQDTEGYIEKCDPSCEEEGCKCTYIKPLTINKTMQFVLTSYLPGDIYKAHHDIHLHGHNFAVLKIGFPSFNRSTGFWSADNPDIICGNAICSSLRWNGQQPELNLQNPPIKDTVVVPSRGYAVIRFRSENPGMWLFHCHQEHHFMEGMGLVVSEGEDHQPPPPPGFPNCENYDWSSVDFQEYMQGNYMETMKETDCGDVTSKPRNEEKKDSREDDGDTEKDITVETGGFVGIVIGFICLGAILSLLPLLCYVCGMRNTSKI